MADKEKPLLLGDLIPEAREMTKEEFIKKHPSLFLLHKSMELMMAERLDTQVTTESQRDKSGSVLERILGLATAPDLHVVSLVRGDRSLFPDRISVGRTHATDICLPHARISKYHAYFTEGAANKAPTITDAGSKNGTFVHGHRLKPNTPVPLPDRTLICFAEFNVRFHLPGGLWQAIREFQD